MKTQSLFTVIALVAYAVIVPAVSGQQGVAPGARGGFPGPGGPGAGERAVVEQFDTDKDGRLSTAERAEARAWLQTQPRAGGRGGARAGGPPMGPSGVPMGPDGAPMGPPRVVGAAPAEPGAAPMGAPGGRRGQGGPPGGAGFPGGGRMGGGRGGGGRGGAAMVASAPGVRLTTADVQRYTSEPLYDPMTIRTLFVRFENADWEQELADFHDTDVEVPAQVTVDGVVYEDVGFAFRGASSFMGVPAGSKRSLNLSFDFANEEQSIGGYRTLNLLNANGDPTFLRTVLYSHIAREYIAAPKVNYVRVVVNGESWGLYASAQQFNKDFTQEFFGTGDGARWKVPGSPNGRGGMEYLGDDVAAYRGIYQIRSKDDPASWSALIGLFRVLDETPASQLEAALEPILDIDETLRFLALDVALVNSDGFWTRASDYNLYQDDEGRFHVIPHDMNEALGIAGNAQVDPLVGLNDTSKALRSKLLAVPALRERYLAYVKDIAETWLDWSRIGPLAEQYRALIAADVKRDTRKLYSTESFDTGFDSLRSFIAARRAYLLGES
jgi:spore coat protein CotH